ncbi:MAG: ABC transporter permease [Patulibacter sp.]|nr:ABC transporter permease [Patulibacter sp.]
MSSATAPMPPAPAAAAPLRAARATSALSDVRTVFLRELRPLIHEPFALLFGMVQPLFFLALFAPLLVATDGLGDAATLQWFVPGLLVMSTLFATSMTGSNLLQEIQTGAHERMLVTPVRRWSLIVGRALKESVPVLGQAVLLIAVSLPFGLDLHIAGVVLGLLILSVLGIGIGALSYTLALLVKDQDWVFWMVQQTLIFPLLLLSGMLLPTDDGPGWLRALAAVNPLTYVVDAERALFGGDLTTAALWGALAAIGTAVVGLYVGVRTISRSAN